MKKYILLIILGMAVICGGYLTTPKSFPPEYSLATQQRAAVEVVSVTADATALTVSTSSWADARSSFIEIPSHWNSISLSFYGYGDGAGEGDPCDSTFSYDVHLCDYLGGIEPVATANSGTIGAQQMSHNPVTGAELNSGAVDSNSCWADDLNQGTDHWSSDPNNIRLAFTNHESNDQRAKMEFDRKSAYGIWVYIYDMTAQSVTSITCVMNGY